MAFRKLERHGLQELSEIYRGRKVSERKAHPRIVKQPHQLSCF